MKFPFQRRDKWQQQKKLTKLDNYFEQLIEEIALRCQLIRFRVINCQHLKYVDVLIHGFLIILMIFEYRSFFCVSLLKRLECF